MVSRFPAQISELQELAEVANIPIAQTLLGKGCIPEEHPLVIGWMGMHGDACARIMQFKKLTC